MFQLGYEVDGIALRAGRMIENRNRGRPMMPEEHDSTNQYSDRALWPALYEFRVQGRLSGEHWSQWFGGLAVTTDDNGETTIRGEIADQAALYGLLARLRDLALPLLSVNRIRPPGG
jgi:hypothetical protein